jgi:hypothetical protein
MPVPIDYSLSQPEAITQEVHVFRPVLNPSAMMKNQQPCTRTDRVKVARGIPWAASG